MVALHPNILKRDGREAFAVLPYEEFVRVRDMREEYDDVKALRSAKSRERKSVATPLREVRKKLRI